MIDDKTIRTELAEWQAALAEHDANRQPIADIVKGLEALLRVRPGPTRVASPTMPTAELRTNRSAPVGAVSMRSAVIRVLQSAGRPMHVRDILAEAERLGAATNAKSPQGVVGLVLLNLHKKGRAERTAPSTWRWAG
jgi:hypothetical protein